MAGVSAADARSILSIGRPSLTPQVSLSGLGVGSVASASATPTPGVASGYATALNAVGASAAKTRRQSKPEGISRELFALIGPSAPSLSAQLARPKFKPKPKAALVNTKVSKWEWREFTNSARKDGFKLGHWAKASLDPSAEYPFTKYDIQPQSYTYSQDEYTNLLEEPGWTKAETDYLFDLVREYDLRFYVVADRYDFPGGPERSLEDLKDRYYGVCRCLIRSRPWPGDESERAAALAAVNFDKEREIARKKHLADLSTRTEAELQEEEALAVELKRLEQTERAFALARDDLLRRLAGIESGLPGIAAQSERDEEARERMLVEARTGGGPIPGSAGATMGTSGARKRKQSQAQSMSAGLDLESPLSSVPPGSAGLMLAPPGTPTRRFGVGQGSAYDAIHCIHRTDGPSGSGTKPGHAPPFARGMKLPLPRPSTAPKIAAVLMELGLPGIAQVVYPVDGRTQVKIVMPTRENVPLIEGVFDATIALLETKKVVDRVDQDIRVAKERLALRNGGGASASEAVPTSADNAAGTAAAGVDEDGEAKEAKIEPEASTDGLMGPSAADAEDDEDADAEADAEGEEDEADADGETDRGASIAPSVRSSSRKRMKRSSSTSSVGSAATATTATTTATGRTSRKRMRT